MKKCVICGNPHKNTMFKTCSQLCQKQHERNLKDIAKAKKQDAKVKEAVKKAKQKEKKNNSISVLSKKADTLWSECIKIVYWYKCAYCHKWPDEVQLHSHHLFTRSRKSTRWNIHNWICLCASHHTLSSEFSAHQTGNEFFLWLEQEKWREFITELSQLSQEVCKISSELIKEKITILSEYKNLNL